MLKGQNLSESINEGSRILGLSYIILVMDNMREFIEKRNRSHPALSVPLVNYLFSVNLVNAQCGPSPFPGRLVHKIMNKNTRTRPTPRNN